MTTINVSTKLKMIQSFPKRPFSHLWYYLLNCISSKTLKFGKIINFLPVYTLDLMKPQTQKLKGVKWASVLPKTVVRHDQYIV